ncbi:hypothetical protein BH23THE1_BH23THE1_15790 [soil metagenome]
MVEDNVNRGAESESRNPRQFSKRCYCYVHTFFVGGILPILLYFMVKTGLINNFTALLI